MTNEQKAARPEHMAECRLRFRAVLRAGKGVGHE